MKILHFGYFANMDISFIIINYRSRHYLGRCIESILNHANSSSFEIIVVNNDEDPLQKISNSPKVRIVEHNINKGFSEAANLGAKNSYGRILFFLNCDTEILDSSIQELFDIFKDHSVGAAAPKLILPDSSPQPWGSGCEITLWSTIKNNLGMIESKKKWMQEFSGEVDWVSGAALAVPREVFEKCKRFDEGFFMYFEDVDLCKRIRGLNKKIMLIPKAKVLHIGGQSKKSSELQKRQYYKSQDYYFKKHFGIFSAYTIKALRSIFLLIFRI